MEIFYEVGLHDPGVIQLRSQNTRRRNLKKARVVVEKRRKMMMKGKYSGGTRMKYRMN